MASLVIAFVQAPGKIVDDTKLPLIMKPAAFMANSLHLWNPTQSSGSVQAGTFGYLLPMGPFFGLGQLLHLPVWITERIWLAILLTVSFWGVVRLAEALGIGSPGGRVLGAVAYTVAPIVVTNAATTVAMLAVVLLPWVLVPLVRGASSGSPRRAAAASGIAVALMSGVNATVVLAVLPLPAIWLLTRQAGPRRRALIGWWVVAVGLACFWWVVATLIEGRYGYNYLPYTETALSTTATTSLFEAVRGASFWTGYLTLGGPFIPGTWDLVSSVVPILGTSLVAALGLAGLARRGIPERLFLVISLFVGVLAIAIGYPGSLGGPAAHGIQNLLDGPLALLRNVSKFSPDVALPLALGLAWLVSEIPWGRLASRSRRGRTPRKQAIRWAVAAVTVAALIAASAPFWQAKLYPPGGFSTIPSYWSAAAQWLDGHQDHGTALLVPGATFGKYTWGEPLDEPLSVYLDSSWTVRSIVPLGSNGNDQVLDSIESSLEDGVAEPGMATYLARAGFDYVVARNDLDLSATDAPSPAQVQQVLSETPGLRLVAGFGPVIPNRQATPSNLSVYDALTGDRHLRSVEIYRVLPAAPTVHTYPLSDPVVVSGSPASLLPLVAAGVLNNRASVLAGDPDGGAAAAKAKEATWADTDGNQRVDVSFGTLSNDSSYVLGPGQQTSAATTHVPTSLAVVPGAVHQTVADPLGAASVSASSYGSTTLTLTPSEGPAAAFQAGSQGWVASATKHSIGQWIQINFTHAMDLHAIEVQPLTDVPTRPKVTKIAISTQRGTVDRALKAGVDIVRAPTGLSTWLRITLIGVSQPGGAQTSNLPLGAGLLSVRIPGVDFSAALRLPHDEVAAFAGRSANDLVYSFSAPLQDANLFLGGSQDDDPQMVRRFSVPTSTSLSLSGTATPLPDANLMAYLPVPASAVHVSASSTLGDLPDFSPDNLLTDAGRPWIAGFGDLTPSLTFTWKGKRAVGSLVLQLSKEASRPRAVVVTGPTGSTVVAVPRNGGTITFPVMITNTLTLRFENLVTTQGVVPDVGSTFMVPIGLQGVSIPALDTTTVANDAAAPFVVPCGFGPTLTIDGRALKTTLTGTIGDVEELRPLALSVCGGPVSLQSGGHILEAASGSVPFKITSVLALPPVEPTAARRAAHIVGAWTAQNRTVRVGSGDASYLVVAQNYNAGWHASLNGRQLAPVRIDGWQQAWVVPAGAGGTVSMTFGPDTDYHVALAVGALFLCALAVLALNRRRSRRDLPPVGPIRRVNALIVSAIGLVVLALVSGALALVYLPVLVIAARWGRRATVVIAGVAFAAAGVAVAISPGAEPATGLGAFGAPAQTFSAIALAAVLASVVATDNGAKRARRRPKASEPTPRNDGHMSGGSGAGSEGSVTSDGGLVGSPEVPAS